MSVSGFTNYSSSIVSFMTFLRPAPRQLPAASPPPAAGASRPGGLELPPPSGPASAATTAALPMSAVVAALGLPLSMAAAVGVIVAGPLRAALPTSVAGVPVPLGVHVDAASAVLVLLVSVVGACVTVFARRQLAGRPCARRFDRALAATLVAVAASVTVASTVLMPVAWAVAVVAVGALIRQGEDPAARRAASAVVTRLLAATAVSAVGLAMAAAAVGTADRADLASAVGGAEGSPLLVAGTLLLVVGVAAQAALVPFSRWLPETSWAPTPVSALLHAGFVNGGLAGLVLVWPLVAAARGALVLLGVLGLASVAAGTLASRVRADVKGRLACSTTTQLGFTAAQLALGLPAGALAHLIGHGLYKATLFLGQGGALPRLPLDAATADGPTSGAGRAGRRSTVDGGRRCRAARRGNPAGRGGRGGPRSRLDLHARRGARGVRRALCRRGGLGVGRRRPGRPARRHASAGGGRHGAAGGTHRRRPARGGLARDRR